MKTYIMRIFVLVGLLCLFPAVHFSAQAAVPALSADMYIFSGSIVDRVPTVGKISASPAGRSIMSRGDYVYIFPGGSEPKGFRYYVFEEPRRILHPVTGRLLGYLVRIKGVVETVGEESGNKKAVIVKSFEDIGVGDLLGKYYPVDLPSLQNGRKPEGIKGVVVMLTDDKIIAGGGNIAYLDKGAEDGVAVGDLFNISSGNVPIGVLQVFNVSKKTATALIKSATDIVRVGDSFGN